MMPTMPMMRMVPRITKGETPPGSRSIIYSLDGFRIDLGLFRTLTIAFRSHDGINQSLFDIGAVYLVTLRGNDEAVFEN